MFLSAFDSPRPEKHQRRDFISADETEITTASVEIFLITPYTFHMTAIAIELDQKLQSLDPETAASVEQLVRDALQLAEKKHTTSSKESHREFIQRIAGTFGDEPFERPEQGEFEKREE